MGKGCLGIIIIVIALHFIIKIGGCIYDEAKEQAGKATTWRDKRLAEKAKEAEAQKAKEAEAARAAKLAAEAAKIKRLQAEAAAEAKRRQEAKDDKIRTFAIKDAPKVWQVYQSLQGEIDAQSGKIEELRKTLVAFNKSPEQDEDFNRICAVRDEMIRTRSTLRAKLEDAYIAAKKYEASPSRKDYQELQKKALEDGILEADQAEAKFKEMRLNK